MENNLVENKLFLDKVKEHNVKLDKLEERIRNIEKDKNLNEYQFKQIMNTLEDLQKDIAELKEKPSKRWELIITGVITFAVSFFMSVIFKFNK